MNDNYPITDSNDIFVYFEVIRMLSPKNIMDVGMFLKRIGAVSRGAMSGVIPRNIQLYGIDTEPDLNIPVMNSIYNSIFTYDRFLGTKNNSFDLTIMLRISDFSYFNFLPSLIKTSVQHSSKILIDIESFLRFKDSFTGTISELKSEDNKYYLINLEK